MARLIWSEEAANDLESICDYIGSSSPHYARVTAQRVIRVAGEIADFPMAGRAVREYHLESLRERVVGNYRVVYQVKADAVVIIGVVHGARRLPPLEGDSDY